MALLRPLLLVTLLTGCMAVETRVKPAAVRIDMSNGNQCSATMVGPRSMLSAAHCFDGEAELLMVDGQPVTAWVLYRDVGRDLIGLVLAGPERPHVKIGPMPEQGDPIFIYGNPGPLQDILRRGHIAGIYEGDMVAVLAVSGGDSGAGVFNRKGELIGVVSGYKLFPSTMSLTRVVR